MSWIFGAVHGITLGFGATLIGEAVDYPKLRLHPGCARRAPADTLSRIGPTLRLAVLTTVFGASAMALSSFQGWPNWGAYHRRSGRGGARDALSIARDRSAGCSCAQGLCIALRRAPDGGTPARKGSWVVAAFVVAGLAVIAWRYDRLWDDDLANLSPLSEAAARRSTARCARNWERPISAISSLPRPS